MAYLTEEAVERAERYAAALERIQELEESVRIPGEEEMARIESYRQTLERIHELEGDER